MNEPVTTPGPDGADRSTSAANVARWRAEVDAFADRVKAELQELMDPSRRAAVVPPRMPESPGTAPADSGVASGLSAGASGPAAERDSETRLRSLREQFAAKLRRFESDGATPGRIPVPGGERGKDEHE